MGLYSSKHYWLVISTSKQAINMFHKVKLDIATNLVVAVASNAEKWMLFEVYNPSFVNGAKLRVNIMGNYTRLTGFEFNISELKYVRRRDMKEIHFKSKIVVSLMRFTDVAKFCKLIEEERKIFHLTENSSNYSTLLF